MSELRAEGSERGLILYFLPSRKRRSFFSSQEDGSPDISDGDIPKCDSSYSIDIPHSETLWEAETRPQNCAEVIIFLI